MSCNKDERNNFNIDVNITNLVLTPLTCASLVSKVIKCLIYEKSQIPYPYEWLKTIVNKKRKQDTELDSVISTNYQAERHFRVVSGVYDATENLLAQINNLFKSGDNVEEIVLLFGGSELSPKEVYRIKIPSLAVGHVESNHVSMTNKCSHTVLRKIFLSQEWMSIVDHTLSPTNMFTFLKTSGGYTDSIDFFVPNSSFYLPKKTRIMNINLIYKQFLFSNCCRNLAVYEDHHKEDSAMKDINKSESVLCNSDDENVESDWYQANVVFKGYKEGFVNKVPLSQLW